MAQLFEQSREDGLRELARHLLHEVVEFDDVVLSCGGGTPCFFDNMDYMNGQAETVYLKARPEVLAQHLKMGKVVRPLILGKTDDELLQYIKDSLEVREPFYQKAKHTLDVSLLDNYETIKISVRLLKQTLGIEG